VLDSTARESPEAVILELVVEYERSTGHASYIFRGSSPGAHEVPVLRL
jgi:hypothetical protein